MEKDGVGRKFMTIKLNNPHYCTEWDRIWVRKLLDVRWLAESGTNDSTSCEDRLVANFHGAGAMDRPHQSGALTALHLSGAFCEGLHSDEEVDTIQHLSICLATIETRFCCCPGNVAGHELF